MRSALPWLPVAFLLAACSSQAAPSTTPDSPEGKSGLLEFDSDEGGFTVVMPGPVSRRDAWEGPVHMVLATSEDPAGAIYEAVYFELPGALTDEEKAGLADQVIRALSGGPGVRMVDLGEQTTSGEPSLELDLALGEAHQGTWRLFFVLDRRMFQLSVVGPADGQHKTRTDGFFDSFRLDDADPAPSGLDIAAVEAAGEPTFAAR